MKNELVRYATGEVMPARVERGVAREAKEIYDRTRLKALEADAIMALGSHLMTGIVQLDQKRKSLVSPEDALNSELVEIEMTAIRQARSIQDGRPSPKQPDPWEF